MSLSIPISSVNLTHPPLVKLTKVELRLMPRSCTVRVMAYTYDIHRFRVAGNDWQQLNLKFITANVLTVRCMLLTCVYLCFLSSFLITF